MDVDSAREEPSLKAVLALLSDWRDGRAEVPAAAGPGDAEPGADWFHRLAWHPLTDRATAPAPTGTWLVVAPARRPDDALVAATVAALEEGGAEVVLVEPAGRRATRRTTPTGTAPRPALPRSRTGCTVRPADGRSRACSRCWGSPRGGARTPGTALARPSPWNCCAPSTPGTCRVAGHRSGWPPAAPYRSAAPTGRPTLPRRRPGAGPGRRPGGGRPLGRSGRPACGPRRAGPGPAACGTRRRDRRDAKGANSEAGALTETGTAGASPENEVALRPSGAYARRLVPAPQPATGRAPPGPRAVRHCSPT
ncbi:hypothetical protein PQR15_30665 [Streptomyces lydicus]|nr:hypothetical protein [Streptomyces lydicus]